MKPTNTSFDGLVAVAAGTVAGLVTYGVAQFFFGMTLVLAPIMACAWVTAVMLELMMAQE